jgi:hypothetical protein
MELTDRLEHLLPHWIEHNEEHAVQLAEWAAKARAAGIVHVADSIGAASAELRRANASLAEAQARITR